MMMALLLALGLGAAEFALSTVVDTQLPAQMPQATPAEAEVAVDEDALEEAFRDHRRRYGEPPPFRDEPSPIDDIGTR